MEFGLSVLGTCVVLGALIIGAFVFIYKMTKLFLNYKRDKNGMKQI